MMYKILIIDDEKKSIDNLLYLIDEYLDEDLDIKFTTDPLKVESLIDSFSPHLVFLDIQMPHYSGFDLLKTLKTIDFELIFTTAYSEFALDAFQHNALDYLLKPVEDSQLIKAFERFKKRFDSNKPVGGRMDEFFERLEKLENEKEEFISISDQDGLHFLNLDNIIRLKAEGNYTNIFTNEEKVMLCSKTLKSFESKLNKLKFLRVHNTHIVNKKFIKSFIKGEYLVMIDGSEIPTSRRRRKELKVFLNIDI